MKAANNLNQKFSPIYFVMDDIILYIILFSKKLIEIPSVATVEYADSTTKKG